MIQAAPAGPAMQAGAATELALLGRVTLSLFVVVVLALIIARLARRARLGGTGDALRVRSRMALTREASLAVVEIGDQALVLGVTPASVQLLTTVDPAVLGRVQAPTDPTVTEPPRPAAPLFGRPVSMRRFLDALRDRTVRR